MLYFYNGDADESFYHLNTHYPSLPRGKILQGEETFTTPPPSKPTFVVYNFNCSPQSIDLNSLLFVKWIMGLIGSLSDTEDSISHFIFPQLYCTGKHFHLEPFH